MNETEPDNATARSVDQQQACAPAFILFYAERLGGEGEQYIAERGVFNSLEEFVPYRRRGWSGTEKTDAAADLLIVAMDEANIAL
ncbi:MAG: hypothetical protein ACRCWR_00885 [Saezia sp.]